MTPDPIRLLEHPPAPGARNMAVDEALMASARAGGTVLRFYRWDPPCLSFGRHQRAAGLYDREAARDRGVDLVRRPTGGRAVYHHREVTYAVAAPAGRWGSLRESYALLNRALLRGLASLGVPAAAAGSSGRAPGPSPRACFRDPLPGEVVVDGRKLVGSAQWREAGALLQHGSVLLRAEQGVADRLRTGPRPGPDGEGGSRRRPGAGAGGEAPAGAGLRDVLGREPAVAEVAAALREGFAEVLGAAIRPSSLTPAERERAEALEERYRDDAWTWRR